MPYPRRYASVRTVSNLPGCGAEYGWRLMVIGMVCKKNVHPIHIERTPQLYMNRISYSLFFPSSLSLGHGGVGVAQLLAHGEVGHGGCDED